MTMGSQQVADSLANSVDVRSARRYEGAEDANRWLDKATLLL